MNWREGFRRLGIALSLGYWAIALLIASNAYNGPGFTPEQTFNLPGSDGRTYTINAYTEAYARQRVADLSIRAQPRAGDWDKSAFAESYEPMPPNPAAARAEAREDLTIAATIYGICFAIWIGLAWVFGGFVRARKTGAP